MNEYVTGTWETDAPLTQEQYAEDRPVLEKFRLPDGMTLRDCAVWVNGREYVWKRVYVMDLGA